MPMLRQVVRSLALEREPLVSSAADKSSIEMDVGVVLLHYFGMTP